MLNVFYFLIFITYVILIFLINNVKLLILLFALQIPFLFSKKINFKNIIYSMYKLLPFILLTFIFNLFFDSIFNSILVFIKLIFVCNATLIYKRLQGTLSIINAISTLFSPLKIVGIYSEDISLIINIALTFIPNFINEYKQICFSLKSKGIKNYSIHSIKLISKLLLTSIFKRAEQLEFTLKSKAYIEK